MFEMENLNFYQEDNFLWRLGFIRKKVLKNCKYIDKKQISDENVNKIKKNLSKFFFKDFIFL